MVASSREAEAETAERRRTLTAARRSSEVSVRGLAAMMSVPAATVAAWERGAEPVSASQLSSALGLLGVRG